MTKPNSITCMKKVNRNKINWPGLNLIRAYCLGYRVIDQEVYLNNEVIPQVLANTGYRYFSYKFFPGRKIKIHVHRFVAFQKYGLELFRQDCVRHFDGNKMNNSPGNILVGTYSENMMDVPKSIRQNRSANAIRKYSNKKIIEIRAFHKRNNSYKQTCKKFNIPSKGSLWYILNNNYFEAA